MQKSNYTILEKIQETPDVATLKFEKEKGQSTSFTPGQFITVYFPETGTPEGKSYTLSSSPHEKYLSITVKAMGEFSNRLTSLAPGDAMCASDPYGFFFTENTETDLVFIAAGIGIAPFRSMILHEIRDHPTRKIILNYSSRTDDDIIFKKELQALQKGHKQLKINHFLTREGARKRIDPQQLIKDLPSLNSPEFFLCGSIQFVRDMWKGLRENGVPEEVIYTEAFFSH